MGPFLLVNLAMENGPLIVDFPIKNGDFPWQNVNVHQRTFIELDDGNILSGKPDQFDGKNPWVSG